MIVGDHFYDHLCTFMVDCYVDRSRKATEWRWMLDMLRELSTDASAPHSSSKVQV